MAIKGDITEIPDSEDEPLSSSPLVTPIAHQNYPLPSLEPLQTRPEWDLITTSGPCVHVEEPHRASNGDTILSSEQENAPMDVNFANHQLDNLPRHHEMLETESPEALQEPKLSHATESSGNSGAPHVADDKVAQSAQQEQDHSEVEASPPNSEMGIRAFEKIVLSPKKMHPNEGSLEKISTLDLPSKTADLQSSTTTELHMGDTSGPPKKQKFPQEGSCEHAETDTTAQTTFNFNGSTCLDISQEPIESVKVTTRSTVDSLNSVPAQQELYTTPDLKHQTDDLAQALSPLHEESHDGVQTLSSSPTSNQTNVEQETLHDAQSMNLETGTAPTEQLTPQERLKEDSKVDLHRGSSSVKEQQSDQSIGNPNISSAVEDLKPCSTSELQRTVDMITSAPVTEQHTLLDHRRKPMPTSDIDATHDSTSEIAATSNGDVEISDAPGLSIDVASTRAFASNENPGTKEVDQHGNRGPHSTIEHTTLPETSNQGASIHDTEITMHAALVKESGELSMQTDYPNSETTPQPQLPASSPSKILLSPKKPSLSKTTQEATVAELRAHRAALITSLAATSKFQELIADDGEEAEDDLNTSPRDPNAEPTDAKIMKVANKIVKTHIKLLHEYNEMKDVGQGLMGLIADSRGVRVVEVQDEFGIEAKD